MMMSRFYCAKDTIVTQPAKTKLVPTEKILNSPSDIGKNRSKSNDHCDKTRQA